MLKIGVLALQGAFIEHIHMLEKIGVEAVEVRLPEDLEGLDGLIIPGGESTTIGKLATTFGLMEPLRDFAQSNPTWGTCAGLIFLAKDIGHDQPILGAMDISVERNAFGRQVDSFEVDLAMPPLGEKPYPAIFIRAPIINRVMDQNEVEVIGELPEGGIVAAKQGRLLATAFHPELTDDLRMHQLFVDMVRAEKES